MVTALLTGANTALTQAGYGFPGEPHHAVVPQGLAPGGREPRLADLPFVFPQCAFYISAQGFDGRTTWGTENVIIELANGRYSELGDFPIRLASTRALLPPDVAYIERHACLPPLLLSAPPRCWAPSLLPSSLSTARTTAPADDRHGVKDRAFHFDLRLEGCLSRLPLHFRFAMAVAVSALAAAFDFGMGKKSAAHLP
jgi:hypothetical protein